MAPTTNTRIPSRDQRASLSRSASVNSLSGLRPKSRGSTTSLQSVSVGNAFQPQPQNHPHDQTFPLDQESFYMQNGGSQGQVLFPNQNEEAALATYQQQMPTHMPHPQHMMEQGGVIGPQPDMRPMSQHGFHEMQQFPMQYHGGIPQYQMPPQHMQHMRHQSEQYEGSPAPEDSNNEGGGARRRRGTASSMANDQELRRLLAQYNGKTLPEVAAEVLKNEGSSGKSEKAKQVFAMLWLQESCERSTNSVRRDRVFARYTEKCCNERVPTLNPASFGKLVRIIFPNVQTRRLGVRGESKYHYVDLSLVPDESDRQYENADRPGTSGGMLPSRPGSSALPSKPFPTLRRSVSVSQLPQQISIEVADFPTPNASFVDSTQKDEPSSSMSTLGPKIDCQYVNTPTIRIQTHNMSTSLANSLPSVRTNVPGTMATYLAAPTEMTLSQPIPSSSENPIEVPDIHEFLAGTSYDVHIAKLLSDLYRSYCIDVIDAFRKCKDKSFFNHHSAFNGKMTVPVAKLFSMKCVAPWIHECDMRMYKQILRYTTPLVLQNVPEPVWASFDRISNRLVGHIVASFEEKCPAHVVVAKVVPAARFANLLKKLRNAQGATLQVSRLLDNPQQRTQMWLDLMAMVDPEAILDESNPPPESLSAVVGVLKQDLRILIEPVPDALVDAAEHDPVSPYVSFNAAATNARGLLSQSTGHSPLLEKWVKWLETLPLAFEGHHPQCVLDWHTRFWRSIMTQVGLGGATSFQAWFHLEAFATQMLAFMTHLEGLLLPAEEQKKLDDRESEKKAQQQPDTGSKIVDSKRKRSVEDVGGEARHRSTSRPPSTIENPEPHTAVTESFPTANPGDTSGVPLDTNEDEDIPEMQAGPLDLPNFRTGFTSPLKPERASNQHDDSGIDLGLDMVDADVLEGEKEAKKFNKRDWFLSSDPVDVGAGPIAT